MDAGSPGGLLPEPQWLEAAGLRTAEEYAYRQQECAAAFDEPNQLLMIDAILEASRHQGWTVIAVANEITHIHILARWSNGRTTQSAQRAVKSSLTQALNRRFGRRRWISRDGHNRKVHGWAHFDYLRDCYLPSHSGWKWDRDYGWFR